MAVTYSGDAATTRTNLGLGSLATASSVNASTIDDNSVGAAELNVSGNGTSGQVLTSDGDGSFSWATAGGADIQKIDVFTSSGTWTKPSGCTRVFVQVVGGGGGGGCIGNNHTDANAGAGAGGAIALLSANVLGSTETVTVGSAGNTAAKNGGNGGTGGQSSFGGKVVANGGGGGSQTYNPASNNSYGNGTINVATLGSVTGHGAGNTTNTNITGGSNATFPGASGGMRNTFYNRSTKEYEYGSGYGLAGGFAGSDVGSGGSVQIPTSGNIEFTRARPGLVFVISYGS